MISQRTSTMDQANREAEKKEAAHNNGDTARDHGRANASRIVQGKNAGDATRADRYDPMPSPAVAYANTGQADTDMARNNGDDAEGEGGSKRESEEVGEGAGARC